MERPIVLIGPVEPIVGLALQAAWRESLTVLRSCSSPPELLAEARRVRAVAVVARRSEVAEIAGMLPSDLLVLGISAASFDLLVCTGRDLQHVTNPDPAAMATLIRSVA